MIAEWILMRIVQSSVNKYRWPGFVVPERAFWMWRDFLCEVRGHTDPIESGYNKGYCRCCFRKVADK